MSEIISTPQITESVIDTPLTTSIKTKTRFGTDVFVIRPILNIPDLILVQVETRGGSVFKTEVQVGALMIDDNVKYFLEYKRKFLLEETASGWKDRNEYLVSKSNQETIAIIEEEKRRLEEIRLKEQAKIDKANNAALEAGKILKGEFSTENHQNIEPIEAKIQVNDTLS